MSITKTEDTDEYVISKLIDFVEIKVKPIQKEFTVFVDKLTRKYFQDMVKEYTLPGNELPSLKVLNLEELSKSAHPSIMIKMYEYYKELTGEKEEVTWMDRAKIFPGKNLWEDFEVISNVTQDVGDGISDFVCDNFYEHYPYFSTFLADIIKDKVYSWQILKDINLEFNLKMYLFVWQMMIHRE